jgi:hypothetical protein
MGVGIGGCNYWWKSDSKTRTNNWPTTTWSDAISLLFSRRCWFVGFLKPRKAGETGEEGEGEGEGSETLRSIKKEKEI